MERSEEIRQRLSGIPDPVRLLEGIFTHAPFGIQIYTPDGHTLLTNQTFRDMFGLEPPPDYNILEDDLARDHGVLHLIHRAFLGETVRIPPFWYDPRKLKTVHVDEGRAVVMESTFFPLFDRQGRVSYVAIVFKDVTVEHAARERAEAQQKKAEEAERRASLLAEVGAVLVGSVDYASALQQVARLLVPSLAEFCTIDVLDDDSWKRVAAAPDNGAGAALMREQQTDNYLSVPLQAHGRVIGALGVGRGLSGPPFAANVIELLSEVGRRVASAIEVARLYQKAREAIRARDEFLSIASHELKTPLTPLQLQIDMLQVMLAELGIDDEQLTARVSQASRQTRRLAGLIENLLDVSRISVGRLSLELEDMDLAEITTEVVERFHDEARRAGCALDVSAGAAVRGRWDRLRLEQVLSNLISNALKYGAGRPVEVAVRAQDGFARLSVRDFGIGISEENLQRIFDRFERAASARHYGGFGLGLYIARQIVEAHGGSIAVESRPDEGSLFVIQLPLSHKADS